MPDKLISADALLKRICELCGENCEMPNEAVQCIEWEFAHDAIESLPIVDTDKLVNLLNQLIEEAVEDGGDAGGAYNQNQEGLTNAINNILDYLELFDYEVVGTNDYSNWSRIKIGVKGEKGEDAD